ncbi:unnamed protein product [Amoebophrya sp. A25]|nr:unnamed protein product [Amoebophrya sp. A25]|eukprot:GSA25T00001731001.1
MPECWTQSSGHLEGQKMLTEPHIENFRKFNSNSGAAGTEAEVAQALSHFSYHASDGTELLCDVQGGKAGETYVLSDVVIVSAEKKYGLTDLGQTGIENFFSQHRCNRFCGPNWKVWEGARRRFQPVMSTTLTLDVPVVREPKRDFVYLDPCHEILFTQSSIKDRFQDGHALLDTALALARQDIKKHNVQMITVVQYQGKYWSLDNRRLAVFRLLQMADRLRTIKCEVVPFERREEEYHRKCDSKTNGTAVVIRQTGEWIGNCTSNTTFSNLHLLRQQHKQPTWSLQECTLFLSTIAEE